MTEIRQTKCDGPCCSNIRNDEPVIGGRSWHRVKLGGGIVGASIGGECFPGPWGKEYDFCCVACMRRFLRTIEKQDD